MFTDGTEKVGSNEETTSKIITETLDSLCRFPPMGMWLQLALQRIAILKGRLVSISGIVPQQHGSRKGKFSVAEVMKMSLEQKYLFRTMEIVLRLESLSQMEITK